MIAARPLYPIPGWQAWLLDVVQAALDWLAAELARPAPLLPRPELAVPDPEAALVGLRRHGRWLVPAPDGRGRWLAPWLLTGFELGWNALPPGVPPQIDRAWRGLCWLLSWVPRPREVAADRRCWLTLGVAVAAVALGPVLPGANLALVFLGCLAALVALLTAHWWRTTTPAERLEAWCALWRRPAVVERSMRRARSVRPASLSIAVKVRWRWS